MVTQLRRYLIHRVLIKIVPSLPTVLLVLVVLSISPPIITNDIDTFCSGVAHQKFGCSETSAVNHFSSTKLSNGVMCIPKQQILWHGMVNLNITDAYPHVFRQFFATDSVIALFASESPFGSVFHIH